MESVTLHDVWRRASVVGWLALSACLDWGALSSDDGHRSDGGYSEDAGGRAFARHPRLSAIPRGTALDLGSYGCSSRFDARFSCSTVTQNSRFNYDPVNHRMLLFGGGAGGTGRTDLDALDLRAESPLTWASVYPSMSCEDASDGANVDERGRYVSTGHPVSRSTMDLSVVAPTDGGLVLALFGHDTGVGPCHPFTPAGMGAIALFALEQQPSRWRYVDLPTLSPPWYFGAAAEPDPVSGRVLVIGQNANAGTGGMWVYDLTQERVVAFVPLRHGEGNTTLVYHPQRDTFFHFGPYQSLVVHEVAFNRSVYSNTTSTVVQHTGTAPPNPEGLVWDPITRSIGGAVNAERWFRFDPSTRAFTAVPITLQSDDGAAMGSQTDFTLDFDPVNEVFLFLARGPSGLRTWAYRP